MLVPIKIVITNNVITNIFLFLYLCNINGFNLNLEKMTNDDIKITGKIESIEIERTEE